MKLDELKTRFQMRVGSTMGTDIDSAALEMINDYEKLEKKNAELLEYNRRFNEKLAQANNLLEKDVTYINKLLELNAELKQQNDNLKCCGNCISFPYKTECPHKDKLHQDCAKYCPSWKSDRLTQKERTI